MIDISEHKKELYSFDSTLVTPTGENLTIDCHIKLPNIWGEKLDIELAIPNSSMPIKGFSNPSQIKATCDHSNTTLKMKDVHYHTLTTSILPSRKMGQTLISIAHIESLLLNEKVNIGENKFYVYISSSDFFEKFTVSINNEQCEDLSMFKCPCLGVIKLQRYKVLAGINNGNKVLQSYGYQLEISFSENVSTEECILEHISGLLDVLSILLRQRIAVLGWQSLKSGSRTRFWKYPIGPIETNYSGVEPKSYLVSVKDFEQQVNLGFINYQLLPEQTRKAIYQLSYTLSPAIKLRVEERFMSLFKGLESIASKLPCTKVLTPDDHLLVKCLDDVSKSFEHTNPQISERINGFISMVNRRDLPLKDKIVLLLKKHNVQFNDLWEISSEKGLTGIRNKLAHKGSIGVNHQGLAVSTFHLSLMVERLVFRILGLTLDPHIATEIKQDEWLSNSYFNTLKKDVFKV
ncbi:hypothetical protein ACNPDB_004215 [Vibrio vulnificus]|nr:hypothetical protein [Vibrio vulnificus]